MMRRDTQYLVSRFILTTARHTADFQNSVELIIRSYHLPVEGFTVVLLPNSARTTRDLPPAGVENPIQNIVSSLASMGDMTSPVGMDQEYRFVVWTGPGIYSMGHSTKAYLVISPTDNTMSSTAGYPWQYHPVPTIRPSDVLILIDQKTAISSFKEQYWSLGQLLIPTHLPEPLCYPS